MNKVIEHYDLLIEGNNDSVRDPEILKEYMDKWDGKKFIEKLSVNKNKSVLEIGVGTGRLAVRVAPLCRIFLGIDISPKTIERARENLSVHENAELICGDFLTYNFEQKFDIVYSSLTFMHIKDKQKAFNKVNNILKIGGRFVLSIDKNQNEYIDIGTRKIKIYPDDEENTVRYIDKSNLLLKEKLETEFAYIFDIMKK